jgi:hypothetical protein
MEVPKHDFRDEWAEIDSVVIDFGGSALFQPDLEA